MSFHLANPNKPFIDSILKGSKLYCFDIGGANGLQPHWGTMVGGVEIISFEPHPESFEDIRSKYATYFYKNSFHLLNIGLARQTGETTLYVLNVPTGSSIMPVDYNSEYYSPEDTYVNPVREKKIGVQSLEDVLAKNTSLSIDMIKLDVQGAELEILKGAGEKTLQDILLVEAEVNIAKGVTKAGGIHVGAPSLAEMEDFLRTYDLLMYDLKPSRAFRKLNGKINWFHDDVLNVQSHTPFISAALWEVDAVYFKNGATLIAQRKEKQLRKLIVALCTYNFFSEAYYWVIQAAAANLFSEAEAGQLKHDIVSWYQTANGKKFLQNTSFGKWINRFYSRVQMKLWNKGVVAKERWGQYMWFGTPNG